MSDERDNPQMIDIDELEKNASDATQEEGEYEAFPEDKSVVQNEINGNMSEDLDDLLNQNFKGRVVRKDLTKKLKEGANVPVYVLEYLLGMYCASDDDDVVAEG